MKDLKYDFLARDMKRARQNFAMRQATRSKWDELMWHEWLSVGGVEHRNPTSFQYFVKEIPYLMGLLLLVGLLIGGLYLINPVYGEWLESLDYRTRWGTRCLILAGIVWNLMRIRSK